MKIYRFSDSLRTHIMAGHLLCFYGFVVCLLLMSIFECRCHIKFCGSWLTKSLESVQKGDFIL